MKSTGFLALVLIALALSSNAGCNSSGGPALPLPNPLDLIKKPATQPADAVATTQPAETQQPGPTTNVSLPTPPPATMTHQLVKDEPCFPTKPAADAQPTSTLKSGTKVLLLLPGSPYTKVMTEDGTACFIPTEGIEPITSIKK